MQNYINLEPFKKLQVACKEKDNSISKMKEVFLCFSQKLMNDFYLKILDDNYEICDIEFYYFSPRHEDFFVHKNKLQKTSPNIYVHKKAWNRAGLGLSFGLDLKEDNFYGSILLRGVKHKDNYFTGISRVKNLIFENINIGIIKNKISCKALEKNHQSLQAFFDTNSYELLAKKFKQNQQNLQTLKIYSSTRLRLSEKNKYFKDNINLTNFIKAKYRFIRQDYFEYKNKDFLLENIAKLKEEKELK